MKIFISWSGTRSRELALLFDKYLRCMVPGLTTFISVRDVGSGEQWHERAREELRTSQFGILCITKESLESNWMLFEAGALAHGLQGKICAVLFDGINPDELPDPLTAYQHRDFSEEEIRQLVGDLSAKYEGSNRNVREMIFDKWWPDIWDECREHLLPASAHHRRARVMRDLWSRETEAEEVWVFSPQLHHDLLNPVCEKTVSSNRERGATYKYIVPKSDVTGIRLPIYRDRFNLNEKDILDQFLEALVGETDLVRFLLEIVIYDPRSSAAAAYGYHPSSHYDEDDIVEFSSNVTQLFITEFRQLWIDAKSATP